MSDSIDMEQVGWQCLLAALLFKSPIFFFTKSSRKKAISRSLPGVLFSCFAFLSFSHGPVFVWAVRNFCRSSSAHSVYLCLCVYKFDEWSIKYIKSIIPTILCRLSGLIVPSEKCDGNGPNNSNFIYCITLIFLFRELIVLCFVCFFFSRRLTIFSIRFYAFSSIIRPPDRIE